MELLTAAISAIGGATVALGGAWWLARTWIKAKLDKELAVFKEGLTRQSDALKVDLSIYAHERSVGLTRIDGQRADAIREIWKALCDWQDTYLNLTAPNKRLHQDVENAARSYLVWGQTAGSLADRLSVVVRDRAIYFDQASFEAIADYGRAITELTCDFYASTFEGEDFSAETDWAALLARVDANRNTLAGSAKNTLEQLRAALTTQFRYLMSAERPASQPQNPT